MWTNKSEKIKRLAHRETAKMAKIEAKRTFLMLAPGHDERDTRVNRSLKVLVSLSFSGVVVYEYRYSIAKKTQSKPQPIGSSVRFSYIESTRRPHPLNILLTLYKAIQKSSFVPDLVYVHDSGILGLFLSTYSKKKYPNAILVYDYHDWIPWEISYQFSKFIRSKTIVRLLSTVSSVIFSFITKSTVSCDAIIGISEKQITHFQEHFVSKQKTLAKLIIPNSRPQIQDKIASTHGDEVNLLWIGNVMSGRDLDKIVDYLCEFRIRTGQCNCHLAILGRVIDQCLASKLMATGFCKYLGAYENDQDAATMLSSAKYIGVFLGWDDIFKTGINEIASPNKVYSYINLGLPGIYSSNLEGLPEVIKSKAGFFIDDYNEFERSFLVLQKQYDTYRDEVLDLRKSIEWSEQLESNLALFLTSVIDSRSTSKTVSLQT